MMVPGSVDAAGNWLEAASMARSIEQELVNDDLLELGDETPEATSERRRSLTAMTRGIVKHLQQAMSIELGVGDLRAANNNQARVPGAAKNFAVVGNQITINAGGLRALGDAEGAVPPQAVTLTGKVK